MMKAARLISLSALMGLMGCFSLSRVEPLQNHYVLGGSEARQSQGPPGGLTGLSIGVRRLRLASYLEPPFLVVRQGSHQIRYSEFHRWGERLDQGINRAVAGYLSARAPFLGVDVAPWPSGQAYDYVIQLHVERFEGLAPAEPEATEGEVHMLATWEIVRQEDGAVLARGGTDYRRPGWKLADHAGMVTLLDAGLDVLSGDLLIDLQKLVAPKAADGIVETPPAAARAPGHP